jgi:WD40 repeat protein
MTVRVWRMEGPASEWRCELTLCEHAWHWSRLAVCGGRMASGSKDGSIVVWDLATGVIDKVLAGHDFEVTALAASGQRLMSSGVDGMVRVWSLATWECVQTVEAYAEGCRQIICALGVCGSTLVGVSCGFSTQEEYEVRVWDLATLAPLHTLKQPVGKRFQGLAIDGGEVWATCDRELVVWGWRGRHWEDRGQRGSAGGCKTRSQVAWF